MNTHTGLWEVSLVRDLVAQDVRGEPIPDFAALVARDALGTMFRAAAAHGLTAADVVRSVLRPVFERRRGCDCPTCAARRADAASQRGHLTPAL